MAEPRLQIQGVTLSLELKDLNYGSGPARFISIKGGMPEGSENSGIPFENIDDVVDQSLQMFITAWKSLQMARFCANEVDGETLMKMLKRSEIRLEKMYKALKED